MRLLIPFLLLASSAFSGCTQGDDRDDDFEGTCPAWVEGLSSHVYRGGFPANFTSFEKKDEFGNGLKEFRGDPLDIVSIDFGRTDKGEQQGIFVVDGILTATFSRMDTGEAVKVYDISKGARGPANPGQSQWTFQPNDDGYLNFTWQADLADRDQDPKPSGVRVDWFFQRNLDNDPDTPSMAVIAYTVNFWYRTC